MVELKPSKLKTRVRFPSPAPRSNSVGVFSPIAEFKLRYELMPRLYLQAMSGVAQAVDIFYRFTL